MSLINEIYDCGTLTQDELGIFVRLLCPIAPHLCEEIWESLGEKGFCSLAPWPEYDAAKIKDETVNIAVQINGKLRTTLVLPADVDRESAVAAAKADARVQSFLAGKGVVKEIFVPGRIVNLVVK